MAERYIGESSFDQPDSAGNTANAPEDAVVISNAPEDAVVISEALRRVRNAVGACLVRADGNLNQRDFYDALDAEFAEAQRKAYPEESRDG